MRRLIRTVVLLALMFLAGFVFGHLLVRVLLSQGRTVTLAAAPKDTFLVTLTPGAVGACTIYQQQVVGTPDANFPDGRYTPRHCWMLGPTVSRFEDDWDFIRPEQTAWRIWVEVQYPDALETPVVSNVLTVTR